MEDGRNTTSDFSTRYERGVRGYTIYFDPLDFPGKYVVRGWTAHMDWTEQDKECELATSLEEAREKVPKGFVWIARHPSDDAKIVECWV